MTSAPSRSTSRITPGGTLARLPDRPAVVLALGIAGVLLALGVWLAYLAGHPQGFGIPLDLGIYRDGGLIAGHVRPWYDPRLGSPLYDWPGHHGLRFTYSPFAALVFIVLALPTATELLVLSVSVGIIALGAAIWFALGALGYQAGLARLGLTLLGVAVTLLLEPVQRTLSLGQIELVLMAVIIWDLCQPDGRRWKGMGVGIAAGIKLVPLIFIPYLLLTRRFRQAAVAAGTFAATVLLGFIVLPADSRAYWLGGVFGDGSRTGFVGFGGNQSLRGMITRLVGSVAGAQPVWLAAAAVTAVTGLVCAAIIDRAGHHLLGVLGCALTGLLVSPVSWDHHWVWTVPAIVALAVYGARARGAMRGAYLAIAIAILGLFGVWPVTLWGARHANYHFGLIWVPPDPAHGGLAGGSWHPVYHWHGFDLLAGNLYVLAGLLLLMLMAVAAVRLAMSYEPPHSSPMISPAERSAADR